jgi:hypothetical protein
MAENTIPAPPPDPVMQAVERLDARLDAIERTQRDHGELLRLLAADVSQLVSGGRVELQRISTVEGRVSEIEIRVDRIPCMHPACNANGVVSSACPVER